MNHEFKIARQDYTNGESYQFSYTMAARALYAVEARVVLPDGSTRSFHTADWISQYVKDIKPVRQ